MIAFSCQHYGEFVLHAPPVCYLTAPMMILILYKEALPRVTKFFSFVIFWIENMIFIFFFALYEMLLAPLVFIKTFLNLMIYSEGLFTTMFKCLIWIISGTCFVFFIGCRDIYFLIKILTMH